MLQDVACIPDGQRARPVVQCLWSSGPIRFEESPSALEHENRFSLSAPPLLWLLSPVTELSVALLKPALVLTPLTFPRHEFNRLF